MSDALGYQPLCDNCGEKIGFDDYNEPYFYCMYCCSHNGSKIEVYEDINGWLTCADCGLKTRGR